MAGRAFTFAGFEFDAATGELRRGADVVRLEPQPARALALLVERAGELVTRDELSAHLWPDDVTVDFDRGLAYCMSQIRGALGETAGAPRFVETLPRRGFRFIMPVEPRAAPEQSAPLASKEPAAIHRAAAWALLVVVGSGLVALASYRLSNPAPRSVLAVATFDNETGDPMFDRDVAGFSDAIVANLVDLAPSEMAVAGQNRVLRLPRSERDLARITDDTGATHVILGQLQRRDGDLVVYAHLLRLPDGAHVWGGTFPVVDGQVGGLHARVTGELAAAVKERLLGAAR